MHIIGVILLFMALGGTIFHVLNGGTKEDNVWHKPLVITHGVAMLLILVAGFGLLARLNISMTQGWVLSKVVIWLLLGAAIMLPYRVPGWARPLALIVPLLGILAVWLVIYRPF